MPQEQSNMRVLLNLFQAFLGQFKRQANIEKQYFLLLDQHIHTACKISVYSEIDRKYERQILSYGFVKAPAVREEKS